MGAPGWNKWAEKLGVSEKQLAVQLQEQEAAEKINYGGTVKEQAFYAEQTIKLAEDHLDFLAGLSMPEVFEHNFPPVLQAAWQLLLNNVQILIKFPMLALGIPRGHAKTTLVKLFILYCILFTKCKFILVISATASMAENIVADVFDMLNEPNIKNLFGDWRIGIQDKNTQDIKKFGFRNRNIIVAAIGSEGNIRGFNLKHERPDIMIFDDIQTKECSESEVQSSALERWMIGTAMKAKSPKGCMFVFTGNMYPGPNSILKKLKKNPNWIKFISGAILNDGTALWEELRSLQSLLDELDNDIAMGHPEVFFSEVLNDTEAGINSRVDLTGIKEWPWPKEELPQGKFIIIDPSTDKTQSDLVAIGYCEVFDGEVGLRHVIEEKLSPGNTIRKTLLLALKTGTRCIVVEANAYQHSLLYWFNVISEELGLTGFYFVDIYSGSTSKNARIAASVKELTCGGIYVHSEVKSKVVYQIANWNPLKRVNVDNILDLLTYMTRIIQEFGPLITTDENTEVIEAQSAQVIENNHAF